MGVSLPKVTRLAYLVSHPIQYQAPLLRLLAQQPDLSLKVFFGANVSEGINAAEFRTMIKWDVPLLEGYDFEFLPALANRQITTVRPLNFGIGRRLSQGAFDVLWVHGYTRPNNIHAILVAKRLGIKVMVRDEANAVHARRGGPREAARRILYVFLKRIADVFLAIGTLNHDYYRQIGVPEDRIFLVPYAVDNSFFRRMDNGAARSRDRLRHELGLTPGRRVILFCGRLTPRKDPLVLLDAYRLLSTDGRSEPDPYLLFIGEGELRAPIEKVAADLGWRSIRVLGFKNQTELPDLYDVCDLFVLPSTYDTWGLVVNEVMNAGKPVIVSDRVGCGPDLVRRDFNGAIFPAGNARALADAISAIVGDKETVRRMGAGSRSIIDKWSFNEDLAGIRAALQHLTAPFRL